MSDWIATKPIPCTLITDPWQNVPKMNGYVIAVNVVAIAHSRHDFAFLVMYEGHNSVSHMGLLDLSHIEFDIKQMLKVYVADEHTLLPPILPPVTPE